MTSKIKPLGDRVLVEPAGLGAGAAWGAGRTGGVCAGVGETGGVAFLEP